MVFNHEPFHNKRSQADFSLGWWSNFRSGEEEQMQQRCRNRFVEIAAAAEEPWMEESWAAEDQLLSQAPPAHPLYYSRR